VWESGGIDPPFLTSALDGGEWPASHPGSLIPGGRTSGTYWIGYWVGPRAGLGSVKKKKSFGLALNRTPAVHSDAIPAELTDRTESFLCSSD
jgi:hypothetical protein